jgi:uncharacterized membrane protein
MCKTLPTHKSNISSLIDLYMSEKGLSWEQCVDTCTDGARSMVGITLGSIERVKAIASECTCNPGIIHSQTVAVKKIRNTLKIVRRVVKLINLIKSRLLYSRVFSAFCDEMGSSYATPLLHTEFRWLSRSRVLVRVFTLHSEIMFFSV